MNIGSFKNTNGMLLGSVATATLHLPRLGMKPVESSNPRAPAFEIMAFNPVGKQWVQIGAVWEATSGNSGETFYQGRIDDPSMTAPLSIALFRSDRNGEPESYAIVWSRPQRREREGFGADTAERSKAPAGDGFEGNATDDGQLARAELDENVPF